LMSIFSPMAVVRKTISLPLIVAERLEREAAERKTSISALIVDRLADASVAQLPYAGLIDDAPDLSLKIEEVLARVRT
jgi:hypothetical protein